MDVTPGQIILVALVGSVLWWATHRRPAVAPAAGAPSVESTPHVILRWGLIAWTIAYPIVACTPLLTTGTSTAGATTAGGLVSLMVGATLFGPWVVGLIVLGVLVWATR